MFFEVFGDHGGVAGRDFGSFLVPKKQKNKFFSNFFNYLLDASFTGCTIRILYALVTLGKLAVF